MHIVAVGRNVCVPISLIVIRVTVTGTTIGTRIIHAPG